MTLPGRARSAMLPGVGATASVAPVGTSPNRLGRGTSPSREQAEPVRVPRPYPPTAEDVEREVYGHWRNLGQAKGVTSGRRSLTPTEAPTAALPPKPPRDPKSGHIVSGPISAANAGYRTTSHGRIRCDCGAYVYTATIAKRPPAFPATCWRCLGPVTA